MCHGLSLVLVSQPVLVTPSALLYGSQTGSYLVGASASATGDNFVAALNAVAGATIASNSSGVVTVTAPTAGTALETLSFVGAAGDSPSVAYTTANVAGATASQYDVSGFTGLTGVTTASEEALNLKLAATTDGTFTTAGGAVSIAGGKDLTVTHSKTAANAIAIAAGSDVTVTANKATTGTVDINGATGTVNVAYNGEFANTANATNGATTVAKVVAPSLLLKHLVRPVQHSPLLTTPSLRVQFL